MTKLSTADVLEIRRRKAAGEPVKVIAHDFGVHPGSIAFASRRRSKTMWPEVDSVSYEDDVTARLIVRELAPLTLEQCASIFGVTSERIRQIEEQALRKLQTKVAELADSVRAPSRLGQHRRRCWDMARAYTLNHPEMSIQEIATHLGVPYQAVNNWRYQARKKHALAASVLADDAAPSACASPVTSPVAECSPSSHCFDSAAAEEE